MLTIGNKFGKNMTWDTPLTNNTTPKSGIIKGYFTATQTGMIQIGENGLELNNTISNYCVTQSNFYVPYDIAQNAQDNLVNIISK